MVVAIVFALASVFVGVARHYSSSLVLYVVEQSLAQKAPPGTDSLVLRKRIHKLLAAAPDQKARMQRLLQISEYLEKIQYLTPEELDELLAVKKTGTSPEIR